MSAPKPALPAALCGKLIISKYCLLPAGHENGCEWNLELEQAVRRAAESDPKPAPPAAVTAAWAQSRNYVADREVNPTSVTFTNGRRVFLNAEGFLNVETVRE